MYYKKTMMHDGLYVDADGVRWDVLAARRVRDAKGVNVGYEEFSSLDDALEAWGLRDSTELCSAPEESSIKHSHKDDGRE